MRNDDINPIAAWSVAIVGWMLGRLKHRWEANNERQEVDRAAPRRDKKAILRDKLRTAKGDPRFPEGIDKGIDTT